MCVHVWMQIVVCADVSHKLEKILKESSGLCTFQIFMTHCFVGLCASCQCRKAAANNKADSLLLIHNFSSHPFLLQATHIETLVVNLDMLAWLLPRQHSLLVGVVLTSPSNFKQCNEIQ